ncbi:MAG: dihydrodipicolinate synthase family protein [Paralcaligenes sp.]
MRLFRGVFANLPTPFDDSGDALDIDRLNVLIDFLMERGVHGVACSLSSGEYPYLTEQERKQVAKEVVLRVAGRVPVIVGVSALTTAQSMMFARQAQEVGADAVMVMPIQYWPLRQDEVIEHFKSISRVTSLPLGIYDNPGLGAARFSIDMYRTLMLEANVKLSKDSSTSLMRVEEVTQVCGQGVSILHGNHMEMLPAYRLGSSGVCTVMASVFPQACLEIYRLSVVEQNWAAAHKYFEKLAPLFRFFAEHSLARCVKEASALMGRPLGPQRRPLSGLLPKDREELSAILKEYGYLA